MRIGGLIFLTPTQTKYEATFERFTEYFLRRQEKRLSLQLKRDFATTRPQLEENLKVKFDFKQYYLVPFIKRDQIEFIFQEMQEVIDLKKQTKN